MQTHLHAAKKCQNLPGWCSHRMLFCDDSSQSARVPPRRVSHFQAFLRVHAREALNLAEKEVGDKADDREIDV